MSIAQTVHPTVVGPLTLAASPSGLTRVRFGVPTRPVRTSSSTPDTATTVSSSDATASAAVLDVARREIDEYLAGRRQDFDVPVDLARVHGEHRDILAALAEVRFGTTTTYGSLATRLGLVDDGPRRVGAAMARNPVLIVVPCHRVVGSGGRLVGYAGGIERKQWLLDLEGGDRAGQLVLG